MTEIKGAPAERTDPSILLQPYPTRAFMPRDKDKNNDSPRGRRDRPTGGGGPRKGRSGTPRGPDKTFAKRAAGGSSDGERRPSAGRPASGRSFGKSSGKSSGKPSYAGKRDARPARGNARPVTRMPVKPLIE